MLVLIPAVSCPSRDAATQHLEKFHSSKISSGIHRVMCFRLADNDNPKCGFSALVVMSHDGLDPSKLAEVLETGQDFSHLLTDSGCP